MLDLNPGNFITVGGISIVSVVLLLWLFNFMGWSTNWLEV